MDDWPTARDLACRIGGPHWSFPPTACYSEAHYQAVGGALDNLDRYDTVFVDSITAVSRLSFRWAEQQPEAFSERTGKKDTRAAYGLHAREMIAWLQRLQHTRGKHVVFVGILEKVTDEFNVATWQAQMEGSRTGRELPGIVDQIVRSTSGTACQHAHSCARRRTPGPTSPKIALAGSSRLRSHTSASSSRS